MTQAVPNPSFGPVAPSERIEVLDILRGFALIGVLYVNMHNFGVDYVWGSVHDVAIGFMEFFFEDKARRLFALLFGIGFAIQIRRAKAHDTPFVRVYLRRLLVLFVIGWAHALLYDGDVVHLYAMLGVVLLAFRSVSSRTVLIVAILVALFIPTRARVYDMPIWTGGGQSGFAGIRVPDPEVALLEARAHLEQDQRNRDRTYPTGSLATVMADNNDWFLDHHTTWPPEILGDRALSYFVMFLLGFYVARRKILEDIGRHRALIRRVMWWGLALGGSSALAFSVWRYVPPFPQQIIRVYSNVLGQPAFMLFYASAITLLVQQPRWHRLFHPLAAVGRMALTAYVGQSVVYTTIYFGYGLGMYGRLGAAHILPIAAVIFAVEIALCNWWIKRFRFGPLEWLWRTLTYMKVQPMRRTEEQVPSVSPAPT